ncbi:MAG: hypothetical protein J7496_07485 [Novosphingobium sp.]|nr:hypothetical protein [Novosphingobium sp.]MBO9602333.1 hypothetical protein [Novosphingobium sp.]
MKQAARPSSIKLFAFLYVAQAAVSFIHNLRNVDALGKGLQVATAMEVDDGHGLAVAVSRLAIALLLGWWLWTRASNMAKWLIILLCLPRLTQIGDAWFALAQVKPNAIFWLVASVLYLAAIWQLFRQDARYWFATKGRTPKNNALVFD